MNAFLHGLARAITETFTFPGPILEVGSYQVEGQKDLIDLRPLFPGREYVGLDVRSGPGVDVVADVESLPYPDKSVGAVLALSALEHVAHFWKGLEEIHRVLRPDGVLLITCPFYFHIHNYPHDYWRFTPDALRMLLEPYPTKLVGWHGPRTRPANVWALAFGEEYEPVTPRLMQLYRARVSQYARMPLPWLRRLRYRVGRLLAGRRPFAPYLDRESWDTMLLTRPSGVISQPAPLPTGGAAPLGRAA